MKPIARQYGAGPENSPYSGTGTGTSQTGNIPIANVPIGNTVIKVYFRRIVLFFYYFIL